MRMSRQLMLINISSLLVINLLVSLISSTPVFAWSPESAQNNPADTTKHLDTQPDKNAEGDQSSSKFVQLYEIPLALSPHDHFLLDRPIVFENVFWTSADYRYGYFVKEYKTLHRGLDIPAVEGTPVLASGDGKVVFAGWGLFYGAGAKDDPYGIAVKIRHTLDGQPIYTVYTHLEKTTVKVGDEVKSGQIIGSVGLTGNTSGPHLHYEVRLLTKDGQINQNPELWLAPVLEHGVLAGRITNQYGYPLNGWKFILTSLESGRDWVISTYDPEILTYHEHDPYFRENYVISDLPAGLYQVSMWYNYRYYKSTVEIHPGTVNYVNFEGSKGFKESVPPGSTSTDFLN